MPYKYVVDVDARPFSDAPDVLLAALGRLTWATQQTVPEEEFRKPNELLTLGYFEKMSIGVSYSHLPTSLCYVTNDADSTMTTEKTPLGRPSRHFRWAQAPR
jgi:hypothetical protein